MRTRGRQPVWRGLGAMAVLTLALALVACGDDDKGPPPFTAQQVAAAFGQATGDRLVSDAGAGERGIVVLTLDTSAAEATIQQQRYGTFSIYVVGEGDASTIYGRDLEGRPIEPTRDGIYWRQAGSAPASWQAAKRYRNVILQWQAGEQQRLDARFQRLDAALSSLLRQRVRLPPADTPCAQRGIDPSGRLGRGACKLGAQTVVVTDRGHRLRLPGYGLSRLRVSVARDVAAPRLGQRTRARGRFVILRFRVFNHGRAALDRIAPTLAVGDRRYEPDAQAQFLLQERSPFPLPAGLGATVAVAFEVPPVTARQALRRGALLVAGDPSGVAATVESAPLVGWVRLRRAR
jgi:hypothetical protein